MSLASHGILAELILQPNRGFGAGHNAALKYGRAEFCLVTNIDLTFEANALREVVATAIADAKDYVAWELRQKPYEHPKYFEPITGTTNWNCHACILMRRSAFQKVGGYDEAIFMYGEDVRVILSF
jgi:GT2 family glycosyltransferase